MRVWPLARPAVPRQEAAGHFEVIQEEIEETRLEKLPHHLDGLFCLPVVHNISTWSY